MKRLISLAAVCAAAITHDGKTGEVPLDTTEEGATCITTLQMT